MSELKLEVGKKYFDVNDNVVDVIYYDGVLDRYLGRCETSHLEIYDKYGVGVNLNGDNLVKEYKEPVIKDIEYYVIVRKIGNSSAYGVAANYENAVGVATGLLGLLGDGSNTTIFRHKNVFEDGKLTRNEVSILPLTMKEG